MNESRGIGTAGMGIRVEEKGFFRRVGEAVAVPQSVAISLCSPITIWPGSAPATAADPLGQTSTA